MPDTFHRYLVLEYSAVFSDKPLEVGEYLAGINKATLIRTAALFLGFNHKNSVFEDPRTFLGKYFSPENRETFNEVVAKITQLEQDKHADILLVNPQSSLQLFEYGLQNLDGNQTQSATDTEVNILKAYLLLNQQNTKAQEVAFSSTEHLHAAHSDLWISANNLSMSYPVSELHNYNQHDVLIAQLIKSIFLFEFLEKTPATQPIFRAFLRKFDSETWQEYLKKFLPLIVSIRNKKREGHVNMIVSKNEAYKKGCEFLDNIAISDDANLLQDFVTLRSQPMYKTEEGAYTIICELFLIEMIHKGMYFKLNEINKTLPQGEKYTRDFRGLYCYDFSEKYLVYKLLGDIYRGRYIEYSGQAILEEFGMEGGPDYYIRKSSNMFLYESKDILIDALVKISYDYEQYVKTFKKKLLSDDDGNKAVLQLINNVEMALNCKFPFDTKYKAKSVYIYPIIILHDRQFNVAGLNNIVNSWFEEELTKLKEKGLNVSKVKPVTIIDIDTFVLMQDILRDRTIKMEEVLDLYHKTTKIDKSKQYTTERYKSILDESTLSFSVFLRNYTAERKIFRVPKMLNDIAEKLFEVEF